MKQGESAGIRRAIREAKKIGFVAIYVFDGEERVYSPKPREKGSPSHPMTEQEVIDTCDSVDDSVIHFRREVKGSPTFERAWAQVILGNASDGSEVIADHSAGIEAFNDAMNRATAD